MLAKLAPEAPSSEFNAALLSRAEATQALRVEAMENLLGKKKSVTVPISGEAAVSLRIESTPYIVVFRLEGEDKIPPLAPHDSNTELLYGVSVGGVRAWTFEANGRHYGSDSFDGQFGGGLAMNEMGNVARLLEAPCVEKVFRFISPRQQD